MVLGSCQMEKPHEVEKQPSSGFIPKSKIRFLKHRTSKLGESEGSAFKITSTQVSSVFRANPLPREKARVTGHWCYLRNPCHLLSSTFSENHSPTWGEGDKSHGQADGTGARTEATAGVPSIPARGHRVAGPEERSRGRAAAPGGNRSRPGSASAGSGPPQAPQGQGEGSGAPGRERRLGRRRGKESKLHLEADGGREGRARR